MGQFIVLENLLVMGLWLLVLIAALLFVLIGLTRKQTRLLADFLSAQPPVMNQLAPPVASEGISEEEVAAIAAVIVKMLPGVKTGAIHISPIIE
ncbi:MAG: hypothetical protein K6U80_12570 [Firmicutes bacterium]|nr:hypothetical protein [Bacillota bacterium]